MVMGDKKLWVIQPKFKKLEFFNSVKKTQSFLNGRLKNYSFFTAVEKLLVF